MTTLPPSPYKNSKPRTSRGSYSETGAGQRKAARSPNSLVSKLIHFSRSPHTAQGAQTSVAQHLHGTTVPCRCHLHPTIHLLPEVPPRLLRIQRSAGLLTIISRIVCDGRRCYCRSSQAGHRRLVVRRLCRSAVRSARWLGVLCCYFTARWISMCRSSSRSVWRRCTARATRFCGAHWACNPRIIDGKGNYGAGNEARTRDLNLGKVALYQLSYSRPKQTRNCRAVPPGVKKKPAKNAPKALNWPHISRRRARPGTPKARPPPRYRLELSRNCGHASRKYKIIDHKVNTAATALNTSPSL